MSTHMLEFLRGRRPVFQRIRLESSWLGYARRTVNITASVLPGH
jgi:hypothetical protein